MERSEYKYPANIYLLRVNNRNIRKRCEIFSKLTINTPERRHWQRSGDFMVNFEHISHVSLVFLLLNFNNKCKLGSSDYQKSLLLSFIGWNHCSFRLQVRANSVIHTAQKMKFSVEDFFSKCDQISFLRIWSHLLKKSLMENFIFCAVSLVVMGWSSPRLCYENTVLPTAMVLLKRG